MSNLTRFGISIDKKLLQKFDKLIENSYDNRSEAIRDLIREEIIKNEWEDSEEKASGSLTLVYNHHKRKLTEKMLKIQHNHHHLFKSNLHVHLNHDFCLEVIILQGKIRQLQQISEKLIGLKGVKHGKLVFTASGKEFVED
ncbi:MAG: nickel-responsive transcriptional regulator NikR [Bacillota bacterium]